MARLTVGANIARKSISVNIPAGLTVANRRVICLLSDGLRLVEKPVSGGYGKIAFETQFGDEVGAVTIGADGYSGSLSAWPQYWNVPAVFITTADEGALTYQYLSREANSHWYEISEDESRRERVEYLGLAAADTTTRLSLDCSGQQMDYVVYTVNRSGAAGYRSVWLVMTEVSGAGRTQLMSPAVSGDGVAAVTVSDAVLSVTVSGVAPVKVYAMKLGAVR